MISNPANFFITGSDSEEFTYEGGTSLYHFSPFDNKLSPIMDNNVVFFANNEQHGLDILKRMCVFIISCKAKYIKYNEESKYTHHEYFEERAKKELSKFVKYIEAINENKIKLTLAPKNQFYKVGWASNDTLN